MILVLAIVYMFVLSLSSIFGVGFWFALWFCEARWESVEHTTFLPI